MSSSPEGQSYSSTPPPHHQGKLSVTSESTTISGFTAVNGRGSPPQTYTKVNGVNSVTRVHSSPNMENPVPVQPYDHDTIRVDSGPPRASPQEDPNSGKRKRSIGEGDARNPPREQEEYVPQDQRRSPPPPHNWTTSPAQGTARLPNQQTPYQGPDAEPRETPSWYPARQQRAESPNSDSRLAAALQHETQNLDDRHMRPSETPVMDHIGGTSQHQATATPDPHDLDVHGVQTTAAGVQVDPKKRKRVSGQIIYASSTQIPTYRYTRLTRHHRYLAIVRRLAVRLAGSERRNVMRTNHTVRYPTRHTRYQAKLIVTVLGNNCVRGGFVCEGYANKTTWPKAPLGSQKPTPVAIQAREDYSDTGGLMPRSVDRASIHCDCSI